MARFTRVLKRGDIGSDVEGVSRAFIRDGLWPKMTLTVFGKMPVEKRRKYDGDRVAAQKRLEKQIGTEPDGIYGRAGHEELEDRKAFDAKARALMASWKPDPPPLIEPKQGFDSLHPTLYRVYTMGISLGLIDLGTYNPKSRLPSGAISDHATSKDFALTPSSPSKAIDFGIDPDTGWNNLEARSFVLAIWERPEIEYVILGDKIAVRGEGIRPYTAGGHLNHVHVSGNRKS